MQGERIASWLDSIDPGFGYWLSGFVDGEGCFSIHHQKRTDSCMAALTIALRDDDAAILYEIRDALGLGLIYHNKPRQVGPSKPQVRWDVHRKADVLQLVALFDRYPLRAKKKRDYEIWRRAVLEWQTIVHYAKTNRRDQHAQMKALRRELMAVRSYEPTLAPPAPPASSLYLPGRLFE